MAGTRARQIEDRSGETIDGGAAIDVEHEDVSRLADDIRTEEAEITAALGDASGDVKLTWQIRRIKDDGKSMPFVDEGVGANFPPMKNIRDRFGGGKYQCWIMKNGKLARKITFEIETVTNAVPQHVGQYDAVMEAVRSMQATTQQLLERQTPAPLPPPPPAFTLKDALPIITALGGLAGIKSFFAPSADKVDPLQKLDTVLALAERIADSSGGNNGARETSLLDILKSAIETGTVDKLAEGVKSFAANMPPRAIAPPQQPARPLPAQIVQPPQQTQQPEAPKPEQTQTPQAASAADTQTSEIDHTDPNIMQLQAFLQNLCGKAQKGSDPGLYADLILDDDNMKPFLPMMHNPNIFMMLVTVEPRVGNYREWFEDLIDMVKNPAQGEDAGSGDDDERTSGDTPPNVHGQDTGSEQAT